MTAESNVGARIFLIGKAGMLSGLSEITAATAKLNAETKRTGLAAKGAAVGEDEQALALERLNATMALYKVNLAETTAASDAMATVGKRSFMGIAAAGAVFGYESIKWATAYQTQLTRLHTQAGLTATAVASIGKAAMSNAASLGISPTAYVAAAYHPASTGMSIPETIAITNYAAKAAAIGGAPVEDTTNALTGVMKSYGLGTGQVGQTTARLNAIVGAGNMHYGDLNNALNSGVAATSKTFGIGLSSMGGALAYMTDRGVPAGQAGTHLRMTESLLGAPSAIATKFLTDAGMGSATASSATSAMSQTLQTAGVTTTQLSSALRDNKGGGGIYNALHLLHEDLTKGGLSPTMQAAMISRSFGGGKMGSTVEMMYNQLPQLAGKTAQIRRNGNTGAFNKDWIAETKTYEFQLKKFEMTIETLGTKLGLVLLPALTDIMHMLSGTMDFFDKNKGAAIALGGAVTLVLVPAIGVYLKRALLGANGSIMTVIKGYKQWMSGQTAEQAAMGRADGALVANDAALGVNDEAIVSNDALRSGGAAGGVLAALSGTAGRVLGGAAVVLALKAAGDHAQHAFNHQNVPTLKSAHALEAKIAALHKQMASARTPVVGSVESWGPFGWAGKYLTQQRVPFLENNTAGINARDKPQLAQYQAQLNRLRKMDPAAFSQVSHGPTPEQSANDKALLAGGKPIMSTGSGGVNLTTTIPIVVNFPDGSKTFKTVTKQTKATAARS